MYGRCQYSVDFARGTFLVDWINRRTIRILAVINDDNMTYSKELMDDFKKLYKERGGEDVSDSEAELMLNNLTGYFSLLWDISKREARLEKRLKTEPDGFPVEGEFTCRICGTRINEVNGWYDKCGKKCLICQRALNDGVIPSFIFINDDSYFKMWQMDSYFKLKYQTVKKMIRLGEVVPRIILDDAGKAHEYIFLKKENPRFTRRYNSVRKSWDRNREKVHRAWAKKKKLELIEEYEKKLKPKSRYSRT